MEIKGVEANKCKFYIKTEKVEVEFPASTPQETVDEQKALYKQMEGQDGTCKFDQEDLTDMLTRWNAGSFSSKDWDVAECSGSYFNRYLK